MQYAADGKRFEKLGSNWMEVWTSADLTSATADFTGAPVVQRVKGEAPPALKAVRQSLTFRSLCPTSPYTRLYLNNSLGFGLAPSLECEPFGSYCEGTLSMQLKGPSSGTSRLCGHSHIFLEIF